MEVFNKEEFLLKIETQRNVFLKKVKRIRIILNFILFPVALVLTIGAFILLALPEFKDYSMFPIIAAALVLAASYISSIILNRRLRADAKNHAINVFLGLNNVIFPLDENYEDVIANPEASLTKEEVDSTKLYKEIDTVYGRLLASGSKDGLQFRTSEIKGDMLVTVKNKKKYQKVIIGRLIEINKKTKNDFAIYVDKKDPNVTIPSGLQDYKLIVELALGINLYSNEKIVISDKAINGLMNLYNNKLILDLSLVSTKEKVFVLINYADEVFNEQGLFNPINNELNDQIKGDLLEVFKIVKSL